MQPSRGAAGRGAELVGARAHPLTERREIERLGESGLRAAKQRRAAIEIVDRNHRVGAVQDLAKLVGEPVGLGKLGIGAAPARDVARDAAEGFGAIEAELGGAGGKRRIAKQLAHRGVGRVEQVGERCQLGESREPAQRMHGLGNPAQPFQRGHLRRGESVRRVAERAGDRGRFAPDELADALVGSFRKDGVPGTTAGAVASAVPISPSRAVSASASVSSVASQVVARVARRVKTWWASRRRGTAAGPVEAGLLGPPGDLFQQAGGTGVAGGAGEHCGTPQGPGKTHESVPLRGGLPRAGVPGREGSQLLRAQRIPSVPRIRASSFPRLFRATFGPRRSAGPFQPPPPTIPFITARLTMLCPMLSSSISSMAATGSTLR